ncbi:hypothetical protein [Pseudolabrys sp.]|uniref:hypothetical protein n=1 Tax=Pseudolabrys sp. TaxID=1960880 RepID=UPI003D0ADFEE
MAERTTSEEFILGIADAIALRHELAQVIEELLADEDFPNSPSWVARELQRRYDIRRRK